MAKEEVKAKNSVWDIAKKLNREFKDNNLALTADLVPEFKRLSTGAFGFDYPLFGGMPYGRIIKVSGLQHSGKTTGACLLLKAYQTENPDKKCVYIDIEHSLDLKFQSKVNGIDLKNLLYINPSAGMPGETILDLILDLQQADDIGMIILDSVPALVPKIVIESSMEEDKGMRATMAKKMYPFLSVMGGLVQEKNNIFVLINQVRETAGAMPGSIMYKDPGGKALEYYASVCIRFGSRTFTLGDNMDACKKEDGLGADGFRLKYKITKNKTAPQNRAGGFITYRYKTGVDKVHDLIEIALKFDFIKRLNNVTYSLINLETGEVYFDKDGKELTGKKADLIDYLYANTDFMDSYLGMITKFISGDKFEDDKVLLSAEELKEITEQDAAVTEED